MLEDVKTYKAIQNSVSISPTIMADTLLMLNRVTYRVVRPITRPRMEKELVRGIPFDVIKRTIDGLTILSQACWHKNTNLVKTILEHYNPSEVLVTLGTPSPMWIAANEGHKDILEELVKHCENPREELTKPGPDGTSPLIMAVARSNKSVMHIFRKYCGNDLVLQTIMEFKANSLIPGYGWNTLKCILRHGVASGNLEVLKFTASLNLVPKDISGPHPTSLELLGLLKLSCDPKTSDLTLLSNRYPVFNEAIDSHGLEETKARNREKQVKIKEYKEEESIKVRRPDLSMGQGQAYRSGAQQRGFIPLLDSHVPSNYLDMDKDIITNVLEPFCCLKTAAKFKSETLELSELAKVLVRCTNNCLQ